MTLTVLIEFLERRMLLANARIGVIGDYGVNLPAEGEVADLVKGWNPDYIFTVGDNNYQDGAASTIDQNIGQYYHDYIYNYQGAYGAGSPTRRFLPALGNHDWITPGAQPYLDYFDLPGNERYYDFVAGPIHFYMVDSDTHEPSGTSSGSIQGQWLQAQLAAATEPFKLVLFHHPPYSSAQHGSSTYMRWPFAQWGASAVLAGHDHVYERLNSDGIPYFVDGTGGANLYQFNAPIAQSQFRYNADHGAMRLDATDDRVVFSFFNTAGTLIDSYTIYAPAVAPSVPDLAAASDSGVSNTDNVTNVTMPTFTGTAQPGRTVRIFAEGNLIGSGVATGAGAYNIIATTALTNGARAITANATNPGGGAPSPMSGPLSITIDTVAPHASSPTFLDDVAPMKLRFTFNENVAPSLIPADLSLENTTTSTTISPGAMSLAYDSPTNVATFAFPGFSNGLLPDGRYHALLAAANVTDIAGNPQAADVVLDFLHMIGDANHDGVVNVNDFTILAGNFGMSGRVFSQGDFNYDGIVNVNDFTLLAARFGSILAPAAKFGVNRIGITAPMRLIDRLLATASIDDWGLRNEEASLIS